MNTCRILSFLSFLCFLPLLAEHALAESSPPPTLADFETYLEQQLEKLPEPDKVPGPRGDRRFRFEGGNNIFRIAQRVERDYRQHVSDFPGGMRYSVIGLCRRRGTFGWSFWPYVRYHYPYLMVEVADQYQSEYTPNFIMRQLRDAANEFWYTVAEEQVPFDVELIRSQSVSGKPDLSAIEEVRKRDRLRVWGGGSLHGHTRHEYQLITPISMIVPFPQVPTFNCHDTPPPQILTRSDNPIYLPFTQLATASHMLYPAETATMILSPTWCVGHNLATRVSPVEPFTQIAPPIEIRRLCLSSHGNIFPPITQQSSTRSFGNAAYLATVRAFRIFRKVPMTSMMTNDFATHRVGDRYVDTLQARYPSYLPSSPSSNYTDYGDFREDNFRPGLQSRYRDDPKRAVFTQWKGIRCCPRGFEVFIGPTPQLKGMQDFDQPFFSQDASTE